MLFINQAQVISSQNPIWKPTIYIPFSPLFVLLESLKILFTKPLTTGNPGHGSQFIKNTAAEKVQKLINKLLGFREEQKAIFESDPDIKLGDVTTVNLTTMEGGIQASWKCETV
jgi:hypothetical protein